MPNKNAKLIYVVFFLISAVGAYLIASNASKPVHLKWEVIYEMDTSKLQKTEKKDLAERMKKVLSRRLKAIGVPGFRILARKGNHIAIQLPAGVDKGQVRRTIERAGRLSFKLVSDHYDKVKTMIHASPDHLDELGGNKQKFVQDRIAKILKVKKQGKYDVKTNPFDVGKIYYYTRSGGVVKPLKNRLGKATFAYILLDNRGQSTISGELIRDAYPTTDAFQRSAVGFEMEPVGGAKMKNLTSNNQGSLLAIMIDGVILSMPYIEGEIADRGVIQGIFTKGEVDTIAVILKAGSLPAPLKLPPSENKIDVKLE